MFLWSLGALVKQEGPLSGSGVSRRFGVDMSHGSNSTTRLYGLNMVHMRQGSNDIVVRLRRFRNST